VTDWLASATRQRKVSARTVSSRISPDIVIASFDSAGRASPVLLDIAELRDRGAVLGGDVSSTGEDQTGRTIRVALREVRDRGLEQTPASKAISNEHDIRNRIQT